ncbi:MAG TPA: TetR/AcrR family transcriptional regulator [Pseudolabrys sp.]|nr:TetR/AcrR family transcriptional regulator [Pseudolabrys sp.]
MTIASKKQTGPSAEAASKERRGRGRPPLRSDNETRAIIYEAARHEFAASGFSATSMDDVARRAGVSTKTLYRLIVNKAVLFEAMVTERMDRFVSGVRLRACDGSNIERALREALLACADLVLDGEVIALQRMILSESDKFPEIAETFYKTAMRRTVATLAKWLGTQQERGLIKLTSAGPDAAAGMLLGMLVFEPQRAVMFGHHPLPQRDELERRAQACSALFLQGCAVRTGGV